MKKLVAAVLIVLLGWLAWPLWTAARIREAVLSGDTVTLERRIDWPQVRGSLKQSLPVYLASHGRIAQLLTSLAGSAVVDPIIEAYVSPAGIVQLMASPEQRENLSPRHLRWAFFKSPLAFEMVMRPPRFPDTRVVSLYELRGLEWKLTGVRIVASGP